MQIIKNRQIVADNYRYVADEESVTGENVTVSLARWQQEKEILKQQVANLGIRLNALDDFDALGQELTNLPLIELNFGFFGDGRLFSRAKLLRRAGFQGELRAVGQFMLDQVGYLSKVGINAFSLDNPMQLPVALAALDDFSVSYQA
jgi:uncharacterized protein (DUF934 family)